MTKVENYYHKYSYLADIYSHKIWNSSNIGMELEDIKQELRIKLFLSIKTYAKKWGVYKKTGKMKPIPIEFYLKTVMINQVRDFIKDINKTSFVDIDTIYDISISQEEIEIKKNDIRIGFQYITELFEDKKQKRFMKLFFMYNFNMEKVFQFSVQKTKKAREQEVKEIVNDGLSKIRLYLEEK